MSKALENFAFDMHILAQTLPPQDVINVTSKILLPWEPSDISGKEGEFMRRGLCGRRLVGPVKSWEKQGVDDDVVEQGYVLL